jgi:hypothetical protein
LPRVVCWHLDCCVSLGCSAGLRKIESCYLSFRRCELRSAAVTTTDDGCGCVDHWQHAPCTCCCLLLVSWLCLSTALCHSLADLRWLSCAATVAADDCTPPPSHVEGHPPNIEVGSTGMNPPQSRRADFSRASGGLDSNPGEFLPHGNPGQEDDLNDSSIPTTWHLVCTPLLRGVPA